MHTGISFDFGAGGWPEVRSAAAGVWCGVY